MPVTYNHSEETMQAVAAAQSLVGPGAVEQAIRVQMGAEDFSYMLQARPGSFIFVGNGPTAACHNPAFDFDDEALSYGIGYWVKLVETILGR